MFLFDWLKEYKFKKIIRKNSNPHNKLYSVELYYVFDDGTYLNSAKIFTYDVISAKEQLVSEYVKPNYVLTVKRGELIPIKKIHHIFAVHEEVHY